jgi:hypothetical protein
VTAGLIAVLVRATVSALNQGYGAVLGTWETWALLIVDAAGFFLLKNALQAGRLVASQPGITLANRLVAAAWGVGLFHEQVRTGWWLLGAVLGAALAVRSCCRVLDYSRDKPRAWQAVAIKTPVTIDLLRREASDEGPADHPPPQPSRGRPEQFSSSPSTLTELLIDALVTMIRRLGSWRDPDADRFVGQAVPLVHGPQRALGTLTAPTSPRSRRGR